MFVCLCYLLKCFESSSTNSVDLDQTALLISRGTVIVYHAKTHFFFFVPKKYTAEFLKNDSLNRARYETTV